MEEKNCESRTVEMYAAVAEAIGARFCLWCDLQVNEDGTEDVVAHVMVDGVEIANASESLE